MFLRKIFQFVKAKLSKDKPKLTPITIAGTLGLIGLCFLLNYGLENKERLLIELFFLLNPPKK